MKCMNWHHHWWWWCSWWRPSSWVVVISLFYLFHWKWKFAIEFILFGKKKKYCIGRNRTFKPTSSFQFCMQSDNASNYNHNWNKFFLPSPEKKTLQTERMCHIQSMNVIKTVQRSYFRQIFFFCAGFVLSHLLKLLMQLIEQYWLVCRDEKCWKPTY